MTDGTEEPFGANGVDDKEGSDGSRGILAFSGLEDDGPGV